MRLSAPDAVRLLDFCACPWGTVCPEGFSVLSTSNLPVPSPSAQRPAAARPSVLYPALCSVWQQLLFPWMHSPIRHVQAVLENSLRTPEISWGFAIHSLPTTVLSAKLWVPAQAHIWTPLHLVA